MPSQVGDAAARLQDEGRGAIPFGALPLLDSIGDAVVAIDAEGRVTYWGPGAEELYGLTAAEALGGSLEAAYSYRWASKGEEQDAWTTLERCGRWRGTNVHVLRSGEERHVDSTVTVLRDTGGRRLGLLAVIRDRTAEIQRESARAEAETGARASEQQALEHADELELVLDTVPAAVWIARDPHADRIDANRFGAELLRRRPGENVSVTAPPDERPRNFVPERHGVRVADDDLPIQRAARLGEEVRDVELDIRFEDGEVLHLIGNANPLRAPDGTIRGSVGAFVDATSRFRAEAALRRSEERLRLALRAGRIGIWDYDLVEGSVEWSDETYELLGVPVGAFGRSAQEFFEFVHPDDLPEVRRRLATVLEGREDVYVCEYRVRQPDGATRWFSDMARVVRGADGRALRMAGTVRDVTDERLARSVLVEEDRRKTEFLAVLSHELRNPLAPLRNSIALLDRAPPESDAARRAKEVLRRQADHLSRLVDDLLDLSRITHGKMTVELAPVDARELVRRAYLDAKVLFDARGVELVLSDSVAPLWIEADAARFAQMVGNLLSNALKFTPPRGTVQLAIARRGSSCEVRVKDSGLGLESADLERIFDPFEQAATRAREGGGGLGLGLAVVRRIAERHRGAVCALSEGLGRGAEFVIALPLVPAPESAPAEAIAVPQRAARLLHILVVEDNEDAAESLADLLALGGHRVSIAGTGKGGVASALADPPDLVICDVGLPDMSGHDVIRAIRRRETGRGAFTIALTGYAQPQDRDAALAAGFDAHLPKPPPLEELEALLEDAVRRLDATG